MNFPTFDLTGKVALVTGGSKGIGFGMAQALGLYGAKVLISSRGIDEGIKAVEELREQDIDAGFYAFDVSKKHEVIAGVNRIIEEHQKIDILINNAGVAKFGGFLDLTPEEWEKIIQVNLMGVYNVTRTVLPGMIEQKSGDIINIASSAGQKGAPVTSAYSASKFAVLGLTESLMLE